jgi:hypothetical protein
MHLLIRTSQWKIDELCVVHNQKALKLNVIITACKGCLPLVSESENAPSGIKPLEIPTSSLSKHGVPRVQSKIFAQLHCNH